MGCTWANYTVFPIITIFPLKCKLLILKESYSIRIKVQDLMALFISGQNVATHEPETYELKWQAICSTYIHNDEKGRITSLTSPFGKKEEWVVYRSHQNPTEGSKNVLIRPQIQFLEIPIPSVSMVLEFNCCDIFSFTILGHI